MNCDTLALAERLAKIMSCKDSAEFMYSPGTCKMLINKTKAVQLSRVMFGWDVMWVRMCDSFSPAVNIYQVQKVQKPFLKRNFQPKMPPKHFIFYLSLAEVKSLVSRAPGEELNLWQCALVVKLWVDTHCTNFVLQIQFLNMSSDLSVLCKAGIGTVMCLDEDPGLILWAAHWLLSCCAYSIIFPLKTC